MEVAVSMASQAAHQAAHMANEAVHAASQRAATWVDVYFGPFWENKLPILAATAFWFLHMRLSGSLSHRLSTSYRKLSDAEKVDWCVRTCAITHALLALCTIPGWLSPPPQYVEDRLYAPMTERDRLILCMTVGYFIWDICVCLWYSWGAFFTAHAFASFGVFYTGLYPTSTYYLGFFLGAFEISTPCFHLRELLIAAKRDNSFLFHAASIWFAVTFTLVRVVGGFWVSFYWWCDTLGAVLDGRAHSVPVFIFNMGANLVIMALQVMWFAKLLQAVFGSSNPTAATSKKTT